MTLESCQTLQLESLPIVSIIFSSTLIPTKSFRHKDLSRYVIGFSSRYTSIVEFHFNVFDNRH